MPPPFKGSTAKRVQSTTLLCVGSPEATPSENGVVVAGTTVARLGIRPAESVSAVSAPPRRNVRRLRPKDVRGNNPNGSCSMSPLPQKLNGGHSFPRRHCVQVTVARRLDDECICEERSCDRVVVRSELTPGQTPKRSNGKIRQIGVRSQRERNLGTIYRVIAGPVCSSKFTLSPCDWRRMSPYMGSRRPFENSCLAGNIRVAS